MLSFNPCLNEFVQAVPVCPETANLTMGLTVLQRSSSERLVLVNAQQHPIGLVRLYRLLPYCMPASEDAAREVSEPGPLALPVDPVLLDVSPSIVESLTLLSGELPLQQFLPYLLTQEPRCYALINCDGQFLGLLDSDRLLNFLATVCTDQLTMQEGQRLSPSSSATPRPSPSLSKQQRKAARLTRQLMVERAELEMQVRAQQEQITRLRLNQPEAPLGQSAFPSDSIAAAELTPLSPLLELLERLPLPLMLQTHSGQLVAQNTCWQQQVGELLDPNGVRQEAAALLETSTAGSERDDFSLPSEPRVPAGSPTSAPKSDGLSQSAMYAADVAAAEAGESVIKAGVCHLGAQPNTCVCICSLKNGQEQVLQFVKIPIGNLSIQQPAPLQAEVALERVPELSLTMATAPATLAESALIPQFRLATLSAGSERLPLVKQATSQIDPAQPRAAIEQNALLKGADAVPVAEPLWLILAQDVTQQQQLARELTAKNADLIQLNRLKDEFLACISHELRTPLTAVLGLSSLLKDQTLGELNPRQVHYAQLIYQSGRHLMAVVNDILDLTRMETGQLELVPEPVDIATVCNRALEQAKQLRLLDDKQAAEADGSQLPEFSLEIEVGLEFLVADELRLRQMLVHLLSNAIKFTEADLQFGLKVGRWGGWIAFTVWDTGIGIPTEKQHLIFQKFQQLENPLTRRFEGTGLGLVLTQRLARLHGGDVTFISKEGQGSQFTILLPPSPPGQKALTQGEQGSDQPVPYPGGRVPVRSQRDPHGAAEASTAQTAAQTSTLTAKRNRLVLIVEAVPQFIDTLSNHLASLGFRVVIARSGTEAVEKARRLQPCIIFLNPVLPLLSGWDVLTLLKSTPETRQIPVVVTSTKVDEEQAHRSQADGLLSLPIQAKALRQMMRRLVMEPQKVESPSRTPTVLTVLRLSPGTWSASSYPIPTADLNQLLHSHHYRVLEADDLEQAELLARVWKPNVVLLDGTPINPVSYFHQFGQHTFLASLPLVTLDPEATQAANQVMGLLVFPCLSTPEARWSGDADPETFALLQVIEVAAGYAWRPSILAWDTAALSQIATDSPGASSAAIGAAPEETDWLQALNQYLQTAGFRGVIGRSWQEVLQQAQSETADLLLICWTESTPHATTLQMLSVLQQVTPRPPILVLDHRSYDRTPEAPVPALPVVLQKLALKILPASLAMDDLLAEMHQALQS